MHPVPYPARAQVSMSRVAVKGKLVSRLEGFAQDKGQERNQPQAFARSDRECPD